MANRQGQAEATRRQLLAAARTVFSERGYQATTVAQITDLAETAHGTFYLHFKNKEDAFVAVVGDVTADIYLHSFSPIVAPPHRQRALLQERIAEFLTTCSANARLWRALLEAAISSPAVEASWTAQRAVFHAEVARRLQELTESSIVRPIDAEVTAAALCSMLEWYAFTGFCFDTVDKVEVTDLVVTTLTDLWVHALVPRT